MLINPALNYTKCNFRAIPWTQMTRLDDKKLDKITEPHMQNGLNNSVESTVNYIDWINWSPTMLKTHLLCTSKTVQH